MMRKKAALDQGRVLIVDEDPKICNFLQRGIPSWGITAEYIGDPLQALHHLRISFYNLILLDAVEPEKGFKDLIPEIIALCPDTKIIIMTGCGDGETAITALRLGAFDYLEKPLTFALLAHAVVRALETQKTESGYKQMHEDLKRSRDDLLAHKAKLEQLNNQLMETNRALSLLAQNIESTRQETKKGIVLKIRSLIIPIIEKLQQDRNLGRYHAELTMLISHVKDLTTGLTTDTKILTTLTSTELRIASLIKNGLKTEEIAEHLYISPSTVKTHRKNIRNKLKIKNSRHNLMGYLRSTLAEDVRKVDSNQHA